MKTSSLTNRLKTCTLAALAAVALMVVPAAARADVNTYREALKSTTWVLSKGSDGTSSGTGVLVDEKQKLVITNFHVVGDSRAAVIFFPDMTGDQPNVSRQHYLDNVKKLGIRGRVIATDRKRDLALVQIERIPEGCKAIELAETTIGPGEAVESVGNPGSTDALWVYTSGTVRSVYQKQFRTGAGEHNFKVVETQSPINSGDSGGPVINSEGKLVAIAQAIAPNARLVSYCVDITEVKAFMASPWRLAPLPVKDVLDRIEFQYTQHPTGHFEVQFEQDDKSKQSVFITKDVEYYERADVRKIWALAKAQKEPLTQETMLKLLQQSARTKLGAWTVEQSADGEYMIIYCIKLDATSTPDTVKSAMEYVSKLTVVMKKELQPKAKAESASDTLEEWLKK
jgi:serine protease Do